MIELKVPSVGESITEGVIGKWFKANGAFVKADEPVFEIETDKAAQEVVAPSAGVLEIIAPVGKTVLIGEVVGKIDSSKTAAVQPVSSVAPTVAVPVATPVSGGKEVILSPSAQRIVTEQKLDPATIAGTGPGGRIIKEDVLNVPTPTKKETAAVPVNRMEAAIQSTKTNGTPPPAPGSRETRQKMSKIRERIAQRLVESQQTTATLTTFNEADMTAITELRTRYKDKFKEKQGVNLGFMSFFVKAAIEALKAFPVVNARIDGSDLVMQHFYDIGVAVSTERGLMVPILRDADQMNFAQIEKQIGQLAVKARDGKIQVSDLQGGTFTITNGGTFGSLLSTPILNPPQCAILGMHSIQKRAVVVNDAIVIRPMMYLALSYDHRIIDGREAVQFLVRIKECVENPERMLLEI